MEKMEQIIAVLGSAITLIAALLTFVIKFLKSSKAKRIAEQALKLTEILQPLIVEAEKFVHYSGEEKKQFVLTKVNQYSLENRIRFSSEVVGKQIDEVLLTTTKVNAREKDVISLIALNGISL